MSGKIVGEGDDAREVIWCDGCGREFETRNDAWSGEGGADYCDRCTATRKTQAPQTLAEPESPKDA